MTGSQVFDTIRARCGEIAARARWVQIDFDALSRYGDVLSLSEQVPLSHTEEHHLLASGDATLAYFLILDSINFGSGYFPYLEKDRGASGYFTIAKRLKEWMIECGVPAPSRLSSLQTDKVGGILRQDLSSPHAQELMALFAQALNQLGEWLASHFDGDYNAVFTHSRTAADLIDSLLLMPFYRDIAHYGLLDVPFLKRAQILIQDIAIASPDSNVGRYPDLDRLTVFADNVLPYVLKADGILLYHPWLSERINREELIGSGSMEEIEIRACTVHAVETLAANIRKRRPIAIRELDFHLWNRGQQLKKRVSDLRHRTRCVFY